MDLPVAVKMDIGDPMDFWLTKKEQLPKLFNVARAVLSVPATSAPSERVFSQCSIILDKKRHNLSDRRLESEIFFKFNKSHYC